VARHQLEALLVDGRAAPLHEGLVPRVRPERAEADVRRAVHARRVDRVVDQHERRDAQRLALVAVVVGDREPLHRHHEARAQRRVGVDGVRHRRVRALALQAPVGGLRFHDEMAERVHVGVEVVVEITRLVRRTGVEVDEEADDHRVELVARAVEEMPVHDVEVGEAGDRIGPRRLPALDAAADVAAERHVALRAARGHGLRRVVADHARVHLLADRGEILVDTAVAIVVPAVEEVLVDAGVAGERVAVPVVVREPQAVHDAVVAAVHAVFGGERRRPPLGEQADAPDRVRVGGERVHRAHGHLAEVQVLDPRGARPLARGIARRRRRIAEEAEVRDLHHDVADVQDRAGAKDVRQRERRRAPASGRRAPATSFHFLLVVDERLVLGVLGLHVGDRRRGAPRDRETQP
jgi:hypothetical protein